VTAPTNPEQVCPTCGGTGEVTEANVLPQPHQCPNCDGTGRVAAKPENGIRICSQDDVGLLDPAPVDQPDELEAAAKELARDLLFEYAIESSPSSADIDEGAARILSLIAREREAAAKEALDEGRVEGASDSADIYGSWPGGGSRSFAEHVGDYYATLTAVQLGYYRDMAKPKTPVQAEVPSDHQHSTEVDDPNIPPTPAREGELEQLLATIFDIEGQYQMGGGETVAENAALLPEYRAQQYAAINAYIARRVLEELEWAFKSRASEIAERIAVIKKEAGQ
jgi:hypothetical protein